MSDEIKLDFRLCEGCDCEFIPDRPSRQLCNDCRWGGSLDDDPMESNMDEQMLINIGMGE